MQTFSILLGVAGLIGVVYTVHGHYRPRWVPDLAWDCRNDLLLRAKGGVTLQFEGRELEAVYVTEVGFRNFGRSRINRADIEEPIVVVFPGEILHVESETLAGVSVVGQEVELNIAPLHHLEARAVRIFHTDPDLPLVDIHVKGEIAGLLHGIRQDFEPPADPTNADQLLDKWVSWRCSHYSGGWVESGSSS